MLNIMMDTTIGIVCFLCYFLGYLVGKQAIRRDLKKLMIITEKAEKAVDTIRKGMENSGTAPKK